MAKRSRVARALGEVPLYREHETGEILGLDLRAYLERAMADDMTGGLTVDDALGLLADAAIRACREG